jgi:urease accessory protein
VLKTLPVADRIYLQSELPQSCAEYSRDTLTLGWEERLRAHGRRRSDRGVEFGTSLPRGAILRAGHCVLLDPLRLVVDIVERPEAVFVIEPQTSSDWGLFAYHIGNGHQPLMITERTLVCPDVPCVESLLQHYQIPYTRAHVAFTPVSAVPLHHH